jgi:DNA-binding winged helix-turn-helix (wHTH) protein
MEQQTQLVYELLGFQLDVGQRVLIRDGNLIALTPKAFDVLLFLIQNRGRILEKDELMKAIWPESFVEEGNLSQNIFVLRKILDDHQNGDSVIQTIPRRGYKFVATVNQVDAKPPQNVVKEEDKSSQASVSAEYWNRHTPFRDLRAFEPEDSWLFFGRDSDTDELLSRLDRSPILVVIGDSGSGKSSLIRAGVIPALRQGHLPASGQPIHWRVALLRPTSSPFDYLSETLPASLNSDLSATERMQFVEHCRNKLALGGDALRNAISALSQAADFEGERHRVLVVVDQFEEIFTLLQNSETRKCYIDALLAASSLDGPIPVNLVIILRSDFYANCLAYPSLSRCLETNLYNVQRMTTEQLRESIERRLTLAHAHSEHGLVDIMLEDAGAEPGNLALLEHALSQLWHECGGFGSTLTNATYFSIGRLQGALRSHAGRVYKEIDEAHKQIVQKIFIELVQVGEGSPDTRRRVAKAELLSLGVPEQVEQLLAHLASARLIAISGEGQGAFVEISHETLIRQWPTLCEWVRENREDIQLERKLVHAAQEWAELNQDAGALLQGARLSRAEEWLAKHQDAPAELREYVAASAAARSQAYQKEALSQIKEHAEQNALRVHLGWLFGAAALVSVIVVNLVWLAYRRLNPHDYSGLQYLLAPFQGQFWLAVVWPLIVLLEGVACWVAIKRKYSRIWRAFSYYLFFELIRSSLLMSVYIIASRSPIYSSAYYILEATGITFKSLVILEILIKVLHPLRPLFGRTLAWFCFWAVQGTSVAIAFMAHLPINQGWYSWINLLSMTILAANCMLAAVIVFQSHSLQIDYRSAAFGIIIVFLICNAIDVTSILFFYLRRSLILEPIRNITYVFSLIAWIWVMLHRNPLTDPCSSA